MFSRYKTFNVKPGNYSETRIMSISKYCNSVLHKLPIINNYYKRDSYNKKDIIGYIEKYDKYENEFTIKLKNSFLKKNPNIYIHDLKINIFITIDPGVKINYKAIDLYKSGINPKYALLTTDFKDSKVITLCGSTKFKHKFLEVYKKLSEEGNIVLLPSKFLSEEEKLNLSYNEKIKLKLLHRQKIYMSDKIFVINPENYIGKNTRDEIEFAKMFGMEIEYLVSQEDTNNGN